MAVVFYWLSVPMNNIKERDRWRLQRHIGIQHTEIAIDSFAKVSNWDEVYDRLPFFRKGGLV
jgi:hypothetical protein